MNSWTKVALGSALTLALCGLGPVGAKTNSASGKGVMGQTLTVSPARKLINNQIVTAAGTKYNKNVGIYVAFCEIPEPGKKPAHCFGGININGDSKGSIWISSNAPFYQKFLARPYGTNGTFKVQVMVSRFIDDTDCKVVKCGIITRADHNRGDFRKADVLVPVTFK